MLFSKKQVLFTSIVSFTILLSCSANADSDDNDYIVPKIGVGIGYSTAGTGVETTMRFSDYIGANYSFYKQEEDFNVGSYNDSFDIYNRSFSIDYFPTGKNLYVTAGAVIPNSTSEYSIDGSVIDSGLSSVDASIDIGGRIAPYLGFGLKKNNETGFGYYAEAGATYLKPDISLTGNYIGGAGANATTEQKIKDAEDDLYDQFNDYKINYLIKAGVYYIF